MAKTHNNDFAYDDAGNALLNFFSKAGSLFKKRSSHYGDETEAVNLFQGAWKKDKYKAMQLAMWSRDCRGGSGNRSGFRNILPFIGRMPMISIMG